MQREGDEGGVGIDPLRAWLSVAILLLMTIISTMDRSVISLMVDPIKRDLDISDVQISLLQGVAFVLFYAIITVPMGWLADRFPRRRLIYFGVSGWSLATVSCGLARTFGQLFAARLAVGAGEATLTPAAYSIIGDLFPKRRLSLAVGILACGTGLGGGVAIALGGWIVQEAQSWGGVQQFAPWQLTFMIVGAPGLLLAPLVFLIPKTRHAGAAAAAVPAFLQRAPNYWRWMRSRGRYLTCFCLGAALMATMAYGLSSWNAAYLMRHYGLNPAQVGATLAPVTALASIVGFIGGGWLIDRLHSAGVKDVHFRFFIINCIGTGVLGVIAYTLANTVPAFVACIFVVHVMMPITGPAMGHLQMSTPPIFRARTIALYMLIQNFIGMSLGPTSVALFSDKVLGGPQHIGGGIALMIATLAPVATLLFLIALKPGRDAMAGVLDYPEAPPRETPVVGALQGSEAG
jgi:MFS family permease